MATDQKSEVQKERERIDFELAQLQLEDLRYSVGQRRAQRDQRVRHREATEESLLQSRVDQEVMQSGCPHRKGGNNMEGLFAGNNSNFAVVKHTLPQGGVMVLCQRCQKQWLAPVRSAFAAGAEGAAAYKADLLEYRAALNFPTDNVPSGTQLFQVHRAA